jgi:hypothetical protein
MSARLASAEEGFRFIQDRLDTRDWWLIPVSNLAGAEFVDGIARRFYRGDNALLLDVVAVPFPTEDVPLLSLVLASKSCMSPAQLAEHLGAPAPDNSRDVIVPASTPLSILLWLARHFRWGRDQGT